MNTPQQDGRPMSPVLAPGASTMRVASMQAADARPETGSDREVRLPLDGGPSDGVPSNGAADTALTPQTAGNAARHRGDGLVHTALEMPRLTVTRIAGALGVPRATLEAYRLGTRRMPPALRVRLAEYLARHADSLRELADALAAEHRPANGD